MLGALGAARLITLGRDEASGAPVVQISHEALIRGWPELRSWINERRDALRAERRLGEAAREWETGGREDALLYRGARLVAWEERGTAGLNDTERVFLAASGEARQRERAARRRRVRLGVGGLASAVILLGALAGFALIQRDRAAHERDVAQSRQVAESARFSLGRDPELALLLAQRAYAISPTAQAEQSLRQATFDDRLRQTLRGHAGQAWDARFMPDGRAVVSGGSDGTLRLWRLADPQHPRLLHLRKPGTFGIINVAVSRDGRRLVAAGAGDESGSGALPTPRAPDVLARTGAPPVHREGVAFRPRRAPGGRRRVRTACSSGALARPVRLTWRSARWPAWPSARRAPPRHRGEQGHGPRGGSHRPGAPAARPDIHPLAGVQPDGRLLAGAGDGGAVRILHVATGRFELLRSRQGLVRAVVFARRTPPGERRGRWERTRLGPAAREPTVVLRGEATVWGVDVSADGRQVVSADGSGRIRLWDGRAGAPEVLAGHYPSVVNELGFSPDGRRLASVGVDGTVRFWGKAAQGPSLSVLRVRPEVGKGAQFSPDGRHFLSEGGTAACASGTSRTLPSVLARSAATHRPRRLAPAPV